MNGPIYFLILFLACMWYVRKSPEGTLSLTEGIAIVMGILAIVTSLVLAFITYF